MQKSMPSKEVIATGVLPESTSNTPMTSRPVPSLFFLSGRTILITGGGRGLGITLAAAVLEAGGHAACIDILPEPAATEWAQLKTLAKKSDLTIEYYKCDITDEDKLSETVETIAEAAKAMNAPLMGAVACAGIQQTAPAIEYSVENWQRIMKVNVTGTFLTAKHCARRFVSQKTGGSIVLVASMSGQIANRVGASLWNAFTTIVCRLCTYSMSIDGAYLQDSPLTRRFHF